MRWGLIFETNLKPLKLYLNQLRYCSAKSRFTERIWQHPSDSVGYLETHLSFRTAPSKDRRLPRLEASDCEGSFIYENKPAHLTSILG